jgi:flavin-binding protein dodecin
VIASGRCDEAGDNALAVADRTVARAHKTLRKLRWFEAMRTSGHIENGKVRHYQVTLSGGIYDGGAGLIGVE